VKVLTYNRFPRRAAGIQPRARVGRVCSGVDAPMSDIDVIPKETLVYGGRYAL